MENEVPGIIISRCHFSPAKVTVKCIEQSLSIKKYPLYNELIRNKIFSDITNECHHSTECVTHQQRYKQTLLKSRIIFNRSIPDSNRAIKEGAT